MAIPFYPKPGTVLRCDYSGLKAPEMVKDRPVIIVSPRSRSSKLVTVVPISTTAPEPELEWHYKLVLETPLSPKWPETRVWVKCDMINTFCSSRLDRLYALVEGKRKYYDRRISAGDLKAIRDCISKFLTV